MKFLSTIILVIIFIVSACFAWIPKKVVSDEIVGKTGEVIGGADIESDAVKSLQVTTWDEKLAERVVFKVDRQENGLWIIPSHHNYQADAKEQVGKTAGSVLGVKFGRLVTSDKKAFKELQVHNPLNTEELEGVGTSVIIKDNNDTEVINLIIGKRSDSNPELCFVREKGSNDVYEAKINFAFSTKFIDWVNTSLLDVKGGDIISMKVDNYYIDEAKKIVVPRESILLTRKDSLENWQCDKNLIPKGKELDKELTKRISGAAKWAEISGVRPKPKQKIIEQLTMQNYGFFAQKGKLFANEGALHLECKDGMKYSFFFGELAAGEGLSLTAGSEKGTKKEDTTSINNRYMAIYSSYDKKIDKEYQDALKAEAKDEKKEKESIKILGAKKEKARKAQEKFSAYYFVVSNGSFLDMRPSIKDLFKDKEKSPQK